jgi:hypothetical protein
MEREEEAWNRLARPDASAHKRRLGFHNLKPRVQPDGLLHRFVDPDTSLEDGCRLSEAPQKQLQ